MSVTGTADVVLDDVVHYLTMKVRRPEATSPWGKVINSGHQLHRVSGEMRDVFRMIDRDQDWYTERVTSPTEGIIRDVSEPLSEHRDRGAAWRPPVESGA